MKLLGRILLMALVVLGTFSQVFWLSVGLIEPSWAPQVVALLCAAAAGRFVWMSRRPRAAGEIIPTTVLWAVIAGSISFLAGFIGPIIFMSGANLGPMLGIYVTGPLGFVLGGIAGLIYALGVRSLLQRSKNDSSKPLTQMPPNKRLL